MAVGVPESDVFAAADRVLERGERPTVERVRIELGRGSPARVGQLLEAWWDALARRLAGETRMPELPKAASSAFTELWRVATDEARNQLDAALAERRAAMDAEVVRFEAEKAEWETAIETALDGRARAMEGQTRAEARLEDLQRVLAQHEIRHAEDAEQLKAWAARCEALERERRSLAEQLVAREAAATQERELASTHLRAVEDRASMEIDRARQESKELRSRVQQLEQQAAHALEARRQHDAEQRQALARSENAGAEQRARAQALAEQLARLDGLSEALRNAQDAVREGQKREDALRATLEEERVRDRRHTREPAKRRAARTPPTKKAI